MSRAQRGGNVHLPELYGWLLTLCLIHNAKSTNYMWCTSISHFWLDRYTSSTLCLSMHRCAPGMCAQPSPLLPFLPFHDRTSNHSSNTIIKPETFSTFPKFHSTVFPCRVFFWAQILLMNIFNSYVTVNILYLASSLTMGETRLAGVHVRFLTRDYCCII